MDVLSRILMIFTTWVLALVFIILGGFVAVSIILTIWRLLYYLIHPIYDKWRDWVSDCID